MPPGRPVGRRLGLTWGLNCSRRRCGGRQRPDCSRDPGAGPRGTPYRGARPGRAGARGSSGSGLPLAFSPAQSAQHSDFAVGTGLTDLAPAPPDSAFWASAARHPAPPPAPPGALLPWGLGTGEVEEGSAGADPPRAACALTCGSVSRFLGLFGAVGLCPPHPPAEPRAGEGTGSSANTRGRDPAFARSARVLPGARWLTGPARFPSCPSPAPRVPTLSPPPPRAGLRPAAPPQIRGCLFLLGLSMLSLFGRLCHRLDAGN